ncbi:MAG: PP2C family serine/threonine-protein phosphatase [Planctomycetaceae bacterium]
MRWEQVVEFAAKTDVGMRRQNNEDTCAAHLAREEQVFRDRGHLFVVADGMGGHAVGELASKLAADMVPHSFLKSNGGNVQKAMRSAVENANSTINARGSQNRDFQRMGTTCSALALSAKGAVIGHVGDSRVYRVRRDRIDQLTFDHSLQWELERRGRLKPEDISLQEHRNVITRSLGPEPQVEVDVEGPIPVFADDVFVLCSDGLTAHVTDGEIATIVRDLPPKAACRMLVNLANLRGGTDNCTVIVIRIGQLPSNVTTASVEVPVPVRNTLSWKWLLWFWLFGVGLVCGTTLTLAKYFVPGLSIFGVSALGGIVMSLFAWKESYQIRTALPDDAMEPGNGVPYRSHVARPVKDLLSELASLAVELQRTAKEDGWSVDWKTYEDSVAKSREALSQKRRSQALREYGKAIDALMNGLIEERRATTGTSLT